MEPETEEFTLDLSRLKLFKLLSGEEILAIVSEVSENSFWIDIEWPVRVMTTFNMDEGRSSINLSPWFIYSPIKDYKISAASICILTYAPESLVEYYIKTVEGQIKDAGKKKTKEEIEKEAFEAMEPVNLIKEYSSDIKADKAIEGFVQEVINDVEGTSDPIRTESCKKYLKF